MGKIIVALLAAIFICSRIPSPHSGLIALAVFALVWYGLYKILGK